MMRGVAGRDKSVVSGIVSECVDAISDLLALAALHCVGSGDASSSENEAESRESDEERGGIGLLYTAGLGDRVGPDEQGSSADTKEAASSPGLSS